MKLKPNVKATSGGSFRNESDQEMCNMMIGCDISSSTSGVDASTAGSSSCSDNNGIEGKIRNCNESGPNTNMFDDHSTSLVI